MNIDAKSHLKFWQSSGLSFNSYSDRGLAPTLAGRRRRKTGDNTFLQLSSTKQSCRFDCGPAAD